MNTAYERGTPVIVTGGRLTRRLAEELVHLAGFERAAQEQAVGARGRAERQLVECHHLGIRN